ncbi:MAG: hypothetical protein JG760_1109 [Desulfomicrobiaceae bacterium]|nr:hypothetical protein [Desulfomicrobiaceae bacterium]
MSTYYRPDPDLDFLKECSNEDLNILVHVLLYDREGKQRFVVRRLPNHPLYKQHAPNHSLYWEVIAGEIQLYGSNPLAAIARGGRGKHYIKILGDVCDRFDLRYNPNAATEIIERELYSFLFTKSLQRLSKANLEAVIAAFCIKPASMNQLAVNVAITEAMRFDDTIASRVALCVAHGAAMFASNVGYLDQVPEAFRPALEVTEKPLMVEFDTISPINLTGSAHWFMIPVVMQVIYLRTKHLTQS